VVATRGVVVGVKRLTSPARALCVVRALQSKRGYAWHTDAMNMEHFTVSTYFRVSGQGSSLFGDGFAVWLTTSNRYREGPLHGFSETFTGIGIVFDTFRNLESGHVHKDVAVIVNDGSGPYKLDDGVEPQGCDGDFRYHEGRDDFNVHARSGAAITLNVRAGCCGWCSGARRLQRCSEIDTFGMCRFAERRVDHPPRLEGRWQLEGMRAELQNPHPGRVVPPAVPGCHRVYWPARRQPRHHCHDHCVRSTAHQPTLRCRLQSG